MPRINFDGFKNNQELVKYLGGTLAIGSIGYFIYRKLFRTKFRYPVEIIFDKYGDSSLGITKEKFIANLEKNHELYLLILQRIYPNECTLNLGRSSIFSLHEHKIVFLNSIDSIKRFLNSTTSSNQPEPIANRPKNFIFKLISKNFLGTFFRMYDDKLLEVRKSSLKALHQLIGDKKELDQILLNELKQFMEFIDTKVINEEMNKRNSNFYKINFAPNSGLIESTPLYLQQLSTNLIIKLGLGVSFPYDLTMNTPIKLQITHISELLCSLNIVQMEGFKWLDGLLNKETMEFLSKRLFSNYDFLTKAVVDYKNSSYESGVVNTFADYLIEKQKEKAAKNNNKPINSNDIFSDQDIIVQVFTLLMAGACTTGFTLSWAFFYLSKNKKVQEKIYEEICKTVGNNAIIDSSKHSNLPYTEATVNEILRLSSTQPLITRATQSYSKIESYRLPANTTVLLNAYAVHRYHISVFLIFSSYNILT